MLATHTSRFASRGLMRRRRSAPDTDGCYPRQDERRPVDSVTRPPETPLPPELLPLPEGFELATTTSQARPLLDVETVRL
ncbi:hypothetical protein ABT030_03240 [Streptomyces mirabilis]|uniref:hypothetical protein n=1 Tax=Streptomyces mirabilis TaxID=68239 RepID=UPI003326F5DE